MRETRDLMGMPITVEICEENAENSIGAVFEYFTNVDEQFSPFKEESEVSKWNRKEVDTKSATREMLEVLALCDKTERETDGYFNPVKPDGTFDPSGIVKGWAIQNAARLLATRGHTDFFVDAGGDIASEGTNADGAPWSVGIRNPFNKEEIVKVLYPQGKGVATSGSYIRGAHIYNPHAPSSPLEEIVSITLVGPDILEADRFATAAFAMGSRGISFIESVPGLEGYSIDARGIATMTSGFSALTKP